MNKNNQNKLENLLLKIINSGNMIQLDLDKKSAIGKRDNQFIEYSFDKEKPTVSRVLSQEHVEEAVKMYAMNVKPNDLEEEMTYWETLEEVYLGIEIA